MSAKLSDSDPVGIAGTIGDVTGQFLLPGGVGVAAVSKISKLGKLEKAIRQQGRGRVAAAGPMPAKLDTGKQPSCGHSKLVPRCL